MAAAEQSLQTILDAAKQVNPPPPISNGSALGWMSPQAGPDSAHPVAGPSTSAPVSTDARTIPPPTNTCNSERAANADLKTMTEATPTARFDASFRIMLLTIQPASCP